MSSTPTTYKVREAIEAAFEWLVDGVDVSDYFVNTKEKFAAFCNLDHPQRGCIQGYFGSKTESFC